MFSLSGRNAFNLDLHFPEMICKYLQAFVIFTSYYLV